eukprot:UN11088
MIVSYYPLIIIFSNNDSPSSRIHATHSAKCLLFLKRSFIGKSFLVVKRC